MSTTDQQQSSKSEKKKTFKQYARKPEEAKAGVIPMLKYGKGNNFYKFKAALSEAALREYGNLGKLIEQENKRNTTYLYWISPTITRWEYLQRT